MADTLQNSPMALLPTNKAWKDTWLWLWFAVLLSMLFLGTLLLIAPKVQQKLHAQTIDRLEQASVDTSALQLEWNYRDLVAKGNLPANTSQTEFTKIVRGADASGLALFAQGVRHIQLDFNQAPTISSSLESVSVQFTSDGIAATVEGVVQDDIQRRQLVKAMLDSGVNDIYDHIDVSGSVATPLINNKVALLSNIIKESGPANAVRSEIKMTEDDLYYRISAVDKQSAQIIEKVAAVSIEDFRITGGVDLPGSEAVDILAQASGEKITLSGTLRSQAQHKRLLFAAGEAVGDDNVIDQLTFANSPFGATESMALVDSVAAVISRFARGITGEVRLNGAELSVDARVGSEEVRDYLLGSILPARSAGLIVTENVMLALPMDETSALQSKLDVLMDEVRDSVVFASGDSELTESAMQTLDKISARINEYTNLMVEIEGHTDNVGRALVNEKLSQSRANAVRNYLARQMVDGGRLIAVGYGHRKPIDSNDTAEGRQANRRVHFTVLMRPENRAG